MAALVLALSCTCLLPLSESYVYHNSGLDLQSVVCAVFPASSAHIQDDVRSLYPYRSTPLDSAHGYAVLS